MKTHLSTSEGQKRELSKPKARGARKKKKAKRESLNAQPRENLKSGLIQASKFSTFELFNRRKEKEMKIEDLAENEIAVRE